MLKRRFHRNLLTGLQSRFFHAEYAELMSDIRQNGSFCSASGADML